MILRIKNKERTVRADLNKLNTSYFNTKNKTKSAKSYLL